MPESRQTQPISVDQQDLYAETEQEKGHQRNDRCRSGQAFRGKNVGNGDLPSGWWVIDRMYVRQSGEVVDVRQSGEVVDVRQSGEVVDETDGRF